MAEQEPGRKHYRQAVAELLVSGGLLGLSHLALLNGEPNLQYAFVGLSTGVIGVTALTLGRSIVETLPPRNK